MILPKIVWPYSLFQRAGNFVYFSGQIWIDPESWELQEWIEKQTHQACENIAAICEAAETKMSNIFKTTIFITDMSEYGKVNEIYKQYFSHSPARSCVAVAALPAWAEVEIEVIAEQ